MRKTKTNEAQRRKQAENIRKLEYTEMAEHEPSAAAKRQMQRKPYQAAVLIREQGEQMEHIDVLQFLRKKKIVKGEDECECIRETESFSGFCR